MSSYDFTNAYEDQRGGKQQLNSPYYYEQPGSNYGNQNVQYQQQPPTQHNQWNSNEWGYGGSDGSSQQDMVMNLATNYGQQFAAQGKERLEKFVSVSTLKYYFAVDNAYVGKKLAILLFPFAHTNWSVQYSDESEPVPPRFDVNAADLYIPIMAFVTYVFVAGFVLGTNGRFSPEQLGIISSSAMAWLIFENLIILMTKYVMGISQALRFYDSLAYSGYKYVGINICLIAALCFGNLGYYGALLYCSLAIVFFLIRSIKLEVISAASGDSGRKRKLYLLMYISLTQPFIIYWLTSTTWR